MFRALDVQSQRRTRVASAVVCAIAIAASSHSYAAEEDGKVYPASMCRDALVGSPPITTYSGLGVENNSMTNSAVVVCPIIKDKVFATEGLNEALVRYFKGSSAMFIADLYSFSIFGNSSYVQFKSDSSTTTGFKTLTYTPIGAYSGGYYVFSVVIPQAAANTAGVPGQKSRLISYRVDEI